MENLDQKTRNTLAKEFKTDLSQQNAPLLNAPNATMNVANANTFIRLVAVDTNRDGKTTVGTGDKLGIAGAICHTITE